MNKEVNGSTVIGVDQQLFLNIGVDQQLFLNILDSHPYLFIYLFIYLLRIYLLRVYLFSLLFLLH